MDDVWRRRPACVCAVAAPAPCAARQLDKKELPLLPFINALLIALIMSKYSYVVTACKPGGVSDAFTTSFSGADSSALNVVVARCDMFSVFAVSPEGLQRTMDVPINGKIEFIRPLHFRGRQPDSLLLITVRVWRCAVTR